MVVILIKYELIIFPIHETLVPLTNTHLSTMRSTHIEGGKNTIG